MNIKNRKKRGLVCAKFKEKTHQQQQNNPKRIFYTEFTIIEIKKMAKKVHNPGKINEKN